MTTERWERIRQRLQERNPVYWGTIKLEDIQAGVEGLIHMLGADPLQAELLDTPERFMAAMLEMTTGYRDDPAAILSTTFSGGDYDEIVLLKDIEFTSVCEHHLLPFLGVAHVAYIPVNTVVGISKLARVVHCFSRRLQLQERMTKQIADSLEKHLCPKGVAVVVEATHQCMICRGVRASRNTKMVTSCMLGAFRANISARDEVLKMIAL